MSTITSAPTSDLGKLWMINIYGPDDIYAAPSLVDAYEQAAKLQRFFATMPQDEYSPTMVAVVAEWDGTPETHARNLATYWADFSAPAQEPVDTFQSRTQAWLLKCFGEAIAADKTERNHRFFEEATEAVQANGMTRSEAHQLVDYTFDRPVGVLRQEVGGVMVTLAAMCSASDEDMHRAGEVELARISDPATMAKIRAKQAAKPKHSPLPAVAVLTIDDRVSEIMWTIDKYGRGDTMTRSDLEQAVRHALCWEPPRVPAVPQAVTSEQTDETSIDRAWNRFNAGISDGPDSPYPGMAQAFEKYYSQKWTDSDWRAETSVWAAAWKEAAARALPEAVDAGAIRNAALEEAAAMLLNGSFLHSEAPTAQLAREAAAAIRALKSATPSTIKADHFPDVTEMVAPAQGEEAKAVATDFHALFKQWYIMTQYSGVPWSPDLDVSMDEWLGDHRSKFDRADKFQPAAWVRADKWLEKGDYLLRETYEKFEQFKVAYSLISTEPDKSKDAVREECPDCGIGYRHKLDCPTRDTKSCSPPLMKFDPTTGAGPVHPSEARQYRRYHGPAAWLFNPFTGHRRDARDVGSDPTGLLVVHTDEEFAALQAAERRKG